MTPLKIAAFRIFVRNLEEAFAFYQGALGLPIAAGGPEVGYLVFKAQTCDLVVERVPPDAPPDEQILVGRFTGLSFAVSGIDQLCHALAAQGVQFVGQPERQAWGGTLATLSDPAGNQLQLVEYPGLV